MSQYNFYLDKLLLPIAPSQLKTSINGNNKTYVMIDEGEINILKTAKLTDIEFECDIPQVQYPFAVYSSGFQKAAYFLNYFEQLKTSKSPFQFIVSRTLPNGKVLFSTNIKVSMESYTITEANKNGFDLTVKIKLKQYRDYSTKTCQVTIKNEKATATKKKERPASTTKKSNGSGLPTTYTVKSGDCLWNIAKKYYGNGAKYTKIYNANKDKIKNANLIYPGQVLTIPA